MVCNLIPGISTSIVPEPCITPATYRLLQQYPLAAVEIGYEQAGPALDNRDLYGSLIEVCRHATPPVVSLHAPYQPDRDISALNEPGRRHAVEHTKQALTLAYDLHVGLMVIHCSQDPITPGERSDRLARAHDSLCELAVTARQYHIRLAVEMMPPEWLPAGIAEARRLVADLDPATIGFCLDTNHANLTGDLSDIIHALDSRLWHIHLSDNDGIRQQHWMPFRGVIDWPAFMTALDDIGYYGPVMYELDPHPNGIHQALQDITLNFRRLCGDASVGQ